MKIFLDVGGHVGETVREVIDPRYGFDKIYCFEPSPSCWAELQQLEDDRVALCRFGLWNQTCRKELHGDGHLGASIFADADAIKANTNNVTIDLVRATDWIRSHVSGDDVVFMKLNCEGAECDIIEDLLDSGELARLYNVMIDFDVRQVASLRWREQVVRRRLRAAGLANVCFTEDVMIGATHEQRIRHWLSEVGGEERLPLEQLRARYGTRLRHLSARRGYRARLEGALRRTVFTRLPAPLKATARRLWRTALAVADLRQKAD